MLQLKACPRCSKGDMAVDRDQYGWFRQCILCSFIQDVPKEVVEAWKRERAAAAGVRSAA